jgi:hypothetical protein
VNFGIGVKTDQLANFVNPHLKQQRTKPMENIPNGHQTYQITIKCTKLPQHIPNDFQIYQMAKKFSKFFIARLSKMYENRDFWYENIPSGNPMCKQC